MSTCQMDVTRRQLYIAIFLTVDEKRSQDHHHFPKIATLRVDVEVCCDVTSMHQCTGFTFTQ